MSPVYKLSNAGGMTSKQRYTSMLAGNPAFVDSDYESISTVTVGAGGSASITFSSIVSTYSHLQIRGIGQTSHTGIVAGFIQINGNTTVTDYATHLIDGNGASASAYGAADDWPQVIIPNATSFAGFVIDILDYTNVNKYKTIRALSGYDANGSGLIRLSSGAMYLNTNAVTSITIKPSTGNWTQYSQFALYGVK